MASLPTACRRCLTCVTRTTRTCDAVVRCMRRPARRVVGCGRCRYNTTATRQRHTVRRPSAAQQVLQAAAQPRAPKVSAAALRRRASVLPTPRLHGSAPHACDAASPNGEVLRGRPRVRRHGRYGATRGASHTAAQTGARSLTCTGTLYFFQTCFAGGSPSLVNCARYAAGLPRRRPTRDRSRARHRCAAALRRACA